MNSVQVVFCDLLQKSKECFHIDLSLLKDDTTDALLAEVAKRTGNSVVNFGTFVVVYVVGLKVPSNTNGLAQSLMMCKTTLHSAVVVAIMLFYFLFN